MSRSEHEPEERDAGHERHREEDAMRGPGHARPDEVREDVGLDEDRDADPDGAPLPPNPDRSRPSPLGHDD